MHLDLDARGAKRRGDRRREFGHSNDDCLEPRESGYEGVGDIERGGLDEVARRTTKDAPRRRYRLAVVHRRRQRVAGRRGVEVEDQFEIDREHLAMFPLMREMTVEGVQMQTVDKDFAAANCARR